jgi:filamentous hemagglutinin
VAAAALAFQNDYRSVQDQTRLEAGDAGFDIQVQGNISLTGAAITSTESAVRGSGNRFNTGSLSTQDIQNSANASAQSRGLNFSQDTLSQGKYGVGKAVLGNALGNSGRKQNAASTTQSAIQQG